MVDPGSDSVSESVDDVSELEEEERVTDSAEVLLSSNRSKFLESLLDITHGPRIT